MLFFLIVLCLLVALVFYASRQPDDFVVEKSITINASAQKIFPFLSDFKKGLEWVPFDQDPKTKRVFSGAQTGVGSLYHFDGKGQTGKGWMEITQIEPFSLVKLDLNMEKPFKGQNKIIYSLTPTLGGQHFTWRMEGKLNVVTKIIHLFFGMERMIGGQFTKGQEALKKIAEA